MIKKVHLLSAASLDFLQKSGERGKVQGKGNVEITFSPYPLTFSPHSTKVYGTYAKVLLLSLSALVPLLTTPKVNACATTDVLTQVAIHGSQQPATQSGNFNMGSDGNCLGNSVTGTTTQLYVGSEPVEQTYQGNQFVGGGEFNQTGVSSPVIQTPVYVPVDVYSPAHDPNFFGF